MKRSTIVVLLVALLTAGATLAWAQGSYKLETSPAPTDLPQPLADALAPQGSKVVDASGQEVSDLWLLKSVAFGQGASDAVYPDFTVGALVGVVRFVVAGTDFRGQAIKPGTYTLRYGLLPQDGNHMGVNPYRDFLLLVPVAADTDLGKTYSLDDLVKLSKLASATPHPAVMSLIPTSPNATYPSLVPDDQGRWALEMNVAGKSGGADKTVPVALIVVGQTTQQ